MRTAACKLLRVLSVPRATRDTGLSRSYFHAEEKWSILFHRVGRLVFFIVSYYLTAHTPPAEINTTTCLSQNTRKFFLNKLYIHCWTVFYDLYVQFPATTSLPFSTEICKHTLVFVTARIRQTRLESFSKFSLNGLPFVVYRYKNFTTFEFN